MQSIPYRRAVDEGPPGPQGPTPVQPASAFEADSPDGDALVSGRRFARNGAIVFVGTTLGQGAQLGLLTILAHESTVAQLGLLLAIVGVLNIVIDLVDFGTSWKLVRNVAAGTQTEADGAAYFTSRAVTGLAAAMAVAASGALVGGRVGSTLLWLSPWVLLRVASQGRRALLQMKSKFTAMTQAQFADRGMSAVVGAALLLTGSSGQMALGVGYAVGSLSAFLLSHLLDRGQPLYRREAIRGVFASYAGGRAFGVTLVITDLTSLDLLLLTWVAGAEQAGLFALPSRIALPVTTLATSLAVVALTSLAAERSHRAAWRLLKSGVRWSVLLSGVALLIGIAFAEPLLRIFGGSEYAAAATPLRLVLVASLMSVFNQLLLAYLQSRGYEGFGARVLIPGVLLGLLVVGVAGALAGATGAAFGLVAANALILVCFGWRIRSLLRHSEP